MTYLEFLEEVVNELSKLVKGTVKLEIPTTSFEQPYIKVTFNKANFSVCFKCGIGSEAYAYYRHLCNYGGTESYIGYCVEWLRNCLKYQILKLFVGED